MSAKRLIAGLVLAASAFTAHAEALVIEDGYATFSNKISTGVTSFNDVYTFTIPSLSDIAGNVTSTAVKLKGVFTKDLNLTSFFVTGMGKTYNGVQESYGSQEEWSIEAANLVSGSYSLKVGGNALGTGGSYSGQIVVSPVPEPATWGMMLGGLGLVGMLARRRKAGNDKNYSCGAMAAA